MPPKPSVPDDSPSKTPYDDLPPKAFWRPAVAERSMFDIDELWTPKFRITQSAPVSTFGSCFAQHIGLALKKRGCRWLDAEPPPRGMSEAGARRFQYGVFSARTANIYTTSLLRQWTSWALGHATPPDECWERDGRFFDPFRPAIEPDGFASIDEMRRSRAETIRAFRVCIRRSSVFVFTLGLTECWFHRERGYEYPMCPGTVAGEFDPAAHEFRNQSFVEVRAALAETMKWMRKLNPELRFLLTVSPVPLTATNGGEHVLVATTYSKSVLRAVAGHVAAHDFVDYFPSYEIIQGAPFRGTFFEPNQRGVSQRGVDFVMDQFFRGLFRTWGDRFPIPGAGAPVLEGHADLACEEALLDAFGDRA